MVQFQEVPGLAIAFLIIAVTLAIGSTVLGSMQTQFGTTVTTPSINATNGGLSALSTLANWQPTWAIVIAAVVIIGLISYFWVNRQ
jgi:lipoprotein signal peptidase